MRNLSAKLLKNINYCTDSYEVAKDADALLVLTEWNEFKLLDFAKIKKLMKNPVIFDGRNIYDPQKLKDLNFRYFGVGRN